MKKIKTSLRLAILLFLLLISIVPIQAHGNSSEGVNKNEIELSQTIKAERQAPSFVLPSLNGKEINLEQYRGKKVLINFWATWCPPCKWEMPAMQQLYNEAGKEIEILAINIDPENNVAQFAKENQLTFPILLDRTGEINEAYSILSIPTTFLVNEKGEIKKKHIGAMTLDQMKEFIEQ
ncbi:redoxin domain-containing protein [Bacillus sp. B15-48]|uniref:redoxin domain-containing protein n=1 Tax=Bacillus sp. B15-48 TaxID=1548601 RepID=UPI00193EFACC|nr:redoxin domain-containing protein [Bacillus sp. B15-48]MBM4763441.1 redoxin domain-containing protein [Bacillus sp. B15-48]